jgi:hypothetical protein
LVYEGEQEGAAYVATKLTSAIHTFPRLLPKIENWKTDAKTAYN